MATQLLAPATGAGTSSDFTVANGTPVTVSIKANSGDIGTDMIFIDIKGSGNKYITCARLTRETPAVQVVGIGTFRVRKKVTEKAIGADRS